MFVQNFKYGKIFVLEIWGKKGSKMGYFGIFSKSNEQIWFILLQMEDNIVLHVCAKFQVRINFCSRDMGSKRVKNGVFYDYLKK